MGSTHTTATAAAEAEAYPKPWVETPLIESRALSKAAGCRIFLKLENLQPSGSFKSRGIGNKMLSCLSSSSAMNKTHDQNPQDQKKNSKPHFYSSSGGNAGLACATSATALQCPCTVIVPTSTSAYMIAKIRTAGPSVAVIQHGDSWQEADNFLREEVLPRDAERGVYVPPFDDAEVWKGHATLVQELQAQLSGVPPEAIVCSVGGGGLFAGIMMGLDQVGWSSKVLAMETEGAESLNLSLQRGELVTLDRITSVATTLGAKKVCGKAFEMARSRDSVQSIVLSDAEAAMGCWRLADDERMLVEPACGVSVAVCYDGRLRKLLPGLKRESKVVIVVCGGSNITLDMLVGYRETYGGIEKETITTDDRDVPSTVAVQDAMDGQS
ncbi:MAG: hypothetical protein Q9191_004172 [Dirinaria sp. TL-2023a]